jgi:peptidoglycan/xylan/chitin deacetylase (PgdA/CDA1 family)
MIRKQDLGTLFLYFLGYSRIRNLILRARLKPLTRTVIFHDIPPQDIHHFNANLGFLKRHTNVVRIEDFLNGRLSSKKINVIITFDDGFESWITRAMPLLKKWGLPATFFVSSGFVGLSGDDEAIFLRSRLSLAPRISKNMKSLNAEQVRKIVEEGFALGGHTSNHCRLDRLRDATTARNEIVGDKLRLEKITGQEIKYFSYPEGGFDNPVFNLADMVKEAGYEGAVTTLPGFNGVNADRYLLRRELTSASMSTIVFRARVYGNYDLIHFLRSWAAKVFPSISLPGRFRYGDRKNT